MSLALEQLEIFSVVMKKAYIMTYLWLSTRMYWTLNSMSLALDSEERPESPINADAPHDSLLRRRGA